MYNNANRDGLSKSTVIPMHRSDTNKLSLKRLLPLIYLRFPEKLSQYMLEFLRPYYEPTQHGRCCKWYPSYLDAGAVPLTK